ncbi:MAG: CDP-diacylglycerol diphosphatase [Dissulfurispiraceae bacterium]|jgi:CDP-diacylglycerol pyrophosphatase
MRIVRLSILAVLFLAAISYANAVNAISSDRNELWNIVTNCLDSGSSLHCEDCRSPIEGSLCACLKTTAVWEKSNDYVVIRDRKMCGCPLGFVHGLALPLTRVSGVEDGDRPIGIWRFAWNVAEKRMKASEIALVVNEKTCRSQDQLHVHIVKLNGDGHNFRGRNAATVTNLDEVWSKAEELAQKAQLKQYSILVKLSEMGFVVVVDDSCLEERYTEYECDKIM